MQLDLFQVLRETRIRRVNAFRRHRCQTPPTPPPPPRLPKTKVTNQKRRGDPIKTVLIWQRILIKFGTFCCSRRRPSLGRSVSLFTANTTNGAAASTNGSGPAPPTFTLSFPPVDLSAAAAPNSGIGAAKGKKYSIPK